MLTPNALATCGARYVLFLLAGGLLLIPEGTQEFGINNSGTIVDYFGSGATDSPNKGYTPVSPFSPASFTNENFPGSAQTQVTGIDSAGDTGEIAGFLTSSIHGDAYSYLDISSVFQTFLFPGSPEPGSLMLAGLGALLIGWRWKNARK